MYEDTNLLHFLSLQCILLYSAIPTLYYLLLLYILIESEPRIHYLMIVYLPGLFRFMKSYIFLTGIVTNTGLILGYILRYFYTFISHFC